MLVSDKTYPGKIRNILLIQLGDIGDVVWATPTFRAVKKAYPSANISVLLREGFGSLLEADPHIHKIFEVNQYKGNLLKKAKKQIEFIRGLRAEHFDLVFDLRSDDRRDLYGSSVRRSDQGPPCFIAGSHGVNFFFTHLAVPLPTQKKNLWRCRTVTPGCE